MAGGTSGAAAAMPAFRWCLVMSDTRAADELHEYWQLTAAINRHYAISHGYGFFRARLRWNGTSAESPKLASACTHGMHGPRASPWCKIPVMAYVALHGVLGRRCSRLMYLDSDAYIANLSMSVDGFLARSRRMGDEAVAANGGRPWHLLFSSNAPFQPDGLCTAVFWMRNSGEACGLLRRWWDSPWPNLSHAHPFEQRPMSVLHRFHRAFGERVRLMPTATFFRTRQAGWPINPFVHHMTERFRRQPQELRGQLDQVTLRLRNRSPVGCVHHLSPIPAEQPPHTSPPALAAAPLAALPRSVTHPPLPPPPIRLSPWQRRRRRRPGISWPLGAPAMPPPTVSGCAPGTSRARQATRCSSRQPRRYI